MSIRSERTNKSKNNTRKTTKLGIEQLESRLMNSIDSLESGLRLLNSPGLFGSTQLVSTTTTTNTPPSVANTLQLASGNTVLGRSASLSVMGADNSGESSLKYTWTLVDKPTGGTVNFAANRTNVAKNNTLTFNKTGSYEVLVSIADRQGLTTSSSLRFEVAPTLTSFVIKTSTGKTVSPGSVITTGDIRQGLTIQGLDQFGVALNTQPNVVWSAVSTPSGGTATLTTEGNAATATFTRAGNYYLRALSGSVSSNVAINVTQTLTSINLATPVGIAIDPSQSLSVVARSQQFVVRGFDQFGNAIATSPRATWTATTSPSGSRISAIATGNATTLSFSHLGDYAIHVQSGASTFAFSATVVPTLTSISLRNLEGKVISATSSPSISGNSANLSAVGLDQFGAALQSQTSINWQVVSNPTGGTATLTTNENAVTASFNRAGAYSLRAVSGAITANTSINVLQTQTSFSLLSTSGTEIDSSSPIAVAAVTQNVRVRAYDQFGNEIATVPRVIWTTVSAPTSGSPKVTMVGGIATVCFKRIGSYTLNAQIGTSIKTISFDVAPVLTNIAAVLTNSRQISTGASVSVSGLDTKLSPRGFDQFNQLLLTQPDFTWSVISSPTGPATTVVQTGNEACFAFNRAGVHSVRASSGGVILNVSINVRQTVTSLSVTPGTASVQANATQQFRYQTLDQFGQAITSQPAATWTATGGTISSSGLLTAGTKTGSFSITAKVGTFSTTATFEVTVPAPTPTPTPTPPSNDGTTTTLVGLVNSLYADSQLTRTEVIQVLRFAGTDGVVDSTELAFLRQIIASGSNYAMPAYVRELAKDVVNANPANAKFKGATAGNLAAGSSATLLNNLVDKWFLGADEPVFSGSGLSYQTVVGNLFNGTPSRNDAKQGQLGDCYLIAALASLADKNADAVRNLFIDNNDGTYTVRFYADSNRAADYVTVNRRLPTSGGQLQYSGYGLSATSSATTLWIALAEKAYAQWNETGNEGRDGSNSYAAIEGGWMSYVNAQVLGTNSSNYSFSNTPKQTLINAITGNLAITLGTKTSVSDGLVGGHAYSVTGYNAGTDTFTLHNPWGTAHPGALSWTQLLANCTAFTVADASTTVANNLASVRSSTSETFVGNWTAVVLTQSDSVASVKEFASPEQLENTDPILAILGSTLNEQAAPTVVAQSESSPENMIEIEGAKDGQLAMHLTANLIDLAMSQLI